MHPIHSERSTFNNFSLESSGKPEIFVCQIKINTFCLNGEIPSPYFTTIMIKLLHAEPKSIPQPGNINLKTWNIMLGSELRGKRHTHSLIPGLYIIHQKHPHTLDTSNLLMPDGNWAKRGSSRSEDKLWVSIKFSSGPTSWNFCLFSQQVSELSVIDLWSLHVFFLWVCL